MLPDEGPADASGSPARRVVPRGSPLGRLHRAVVIGAVVIMAALGSIAEGLAVLGSYQDCPESGPPPPAGFVVASIGIVLVCGVIPAVCVGPRHGRAWLAAFGAGAVVPAIVAVVIAVQPQSGLCFTF